MPGQRKRKRRQQEAGRRVSARSGADAAGRWEVIVETQDPSEWRARLRRLRAEHGQIDWSMTRVDTLCGRLAHPTTYRLSHFVPNAEAAPDEGRGR